MINMYYLNCSYINKKNLFYFVLFLNVLMVNIILNMKELLGLNRICCVFGGFCWYICIKVNLGNDNIYFICVKGC